MCVYTSFQFAILAIYPVMGWCTPLEGACVWNLSKETLTPYPKTLNALLQKNTQGHYHF